MSQRYLTKSRFKLALECPTKIYYDGKPEFANKKIDDSFLLALAEGGFQVGELAKYYFPGGHDIETLDYDEALHQTNELLKKDQVIIFEAAIQFDNFFIRTDILVKNKNYLELIEVAFPEYSVSAYLMMADKKAICPTDGLNQKFKIVKDLKGRKNVIVPQVMSEEDLATPILTKVNVDGCCDLIYCEKFGDDSFAEYVNRLAVHYKRDQKISMLPSAACANCEYKATEKEQSAGMKSGFHECWKERLY